MALSSQQRQWQLVARRLGEQYNLPFFERQIWQESKFDPGAKSPAGAEGVAQFMPGTARGLGIDPWNPTQALQGAAKLMRSYLDKYRDPAVALAAYNAGEGNVSKYGGVPPFKETRNYVKTILGSSPKVAGGGARGGAVDMSGTDAAAISPSRVASDILADKSFRSMMAAQFLENSRRSLSGQAPDYTGLFALAMQRRQLQSAADTYGDEPSADTPLAATPSRPTATPEAHDAETGLVPAFKSRLEQMIAASGGRLKINSGYRSPEEQKKLFAAAVKKYGSEAAARKWVAPPGNSMHNKGVAADLGGDLSWAHKNAAKFGLYFPMPWENWHIELQGSRS